MSESNRLMRSLAKLDRLPRFARAWARERAICSAIPFVGTAGLRIREITPRRVEIEVANKRRVQNHIGSVHACVSTLLAETATGLILGMNVPDAVTPVIKSLHVDFLKRSQGALNAVATLDDDQLLLLRGTDSGELEVPVQVFDERGEQPVRCVMLWAWRPRR